MSVHFKSQSERYVHRGKFLAMHFEKKMPYAKIAEVTGKSPTRVGQLVREAWLLVEQGRLQIKDGKVQLRNGKVVI